jgi:N-formylglutamate amidohydrolase
MLPPPFVRTDPERAETPVVVEVPHAGTFVDPLTASRLLVPVERAERDADRWVDELVRDAPHEGATLLCSTVSRYVVDANRDPDDYDALAVVGGPRPSSPRGLVWRMTTTDEPIVRAPVERGELERRMRWAYWPYHRALAAAVEAKRRRFGVAVLLSVHSMPGEGREGPDGRRARRADLVVGTRGRSTCAPGLAELVEGHARAHGWSVAHDDPYRGGATTARWGHPGEGVHAVQIELARRTYMDEGTLARAEPAFGAVRELCRALVAKLGAAALG